MNRGDYKMDVQPTLRFAISFPHEFRQPLPDILGQYRLLAFRVVIKDKHCIAFGGESGQILAVNPVMHHKAIGLQFADARADFDCVGIGQRRPEPAPG